MDLSPDQIAAIDGIDMLFVGPVDLSGSAGGVADFNNPVFVEARARAEAVIRASDKLLGGIPIPGDAPRDMFARGYDFVVGSSDVLMLRDAALNYLKQNGPPVQS